MAKTGYIYREECLKHFAGPHHPERPERLEAIDAALARAGVALTKLPCRPASREDLLRVHSPAHIDTIERTCREELPYPDPDTSMAAGSWEAALLAAGGCIAACEAVLAKRRRHRFLRGGPPPSRRARPRQGLLFNNVPSLRAAPNREEGHVSHRGLAPHGTAPTHSNDDPSFIRQFASATRCPGTAKLPNARDKHQPSTYPCRRVRDPALARTLEKRPPELRRRARGAAHVAGFDPHLIRSPRSAWNPTRRRDHASAFTERSGRCSVLEGATIWIIGESVVDM